MSEEKLMDLVTKEDTPMMSKGEMRKTHENQHGQSGTLFKNGKRVKPKKTATKKK